MFLIHLFACPCGSTISGHRFAQTDIKALCTEKLMQTKLGCFYIWVNEWMYERMNEWTNKGMNEWSIEWKNKRTSERTNEPLDGRTNERTNAWMNKYWGENENIEFVSCPWNLRVKPRVYSLAVAHVLFVRRWQSGKDVSNYYTSHRVRTWCILAQVITDDSYCLLQHALVSNVVIWERYAKSCSQESVQHYKLFIHHIDNKICVSTWHT